MFLDQFIFMWLTPQSSGATTNTGPAMTGNIPGGGIAVGFD